MSLVGSIGYQAGLICDEDILSLGPGLLYKGGYLYDSANGAQHQLSSVAGWVIAFLRQPISWRELKNRLRKRYLQAETYRRIFNFLDDISGLNIARNLSTWLADLYYRFNLQLHFVSLKQPAHRYPGNISGGIRAVVANMRTLLLLISVALAIGYGVNISLKTLALIGIMFYIILFASVIVHEFVHIKIYISTNLSLFIKPVFVQRGLRLGILHRKMEDRLELLSALAGPLSGVFIALLATPLMMLDDLWFSGLLAVSIAVFHLCSWLPMYSDGRVLWRELRKAGANEAKT